MNPFPEAHPWTESPLDLAFGRLMGRLSGEPGHLVQRTAALVSALTRKGHVCADLEAFSGKVLREGETAFPFLAAWIETLLRSAVVGRPGNYRPLVLDDAARLYLYRYWAYETDLGSRIREMAEKTLPVSDPKSFKSALDRLFPPGEEDGGPDLQKMACAVAALKRFCVVSGGPGTGKTTTVVKILAFMAMQHPDPADFRVILAAPTGKAAARLTDAVSGARERLHLPKPVDKAIPAEAATVHRILRPVPGTPYFRHHARNPLNAHAVVVDEASMVDLALMAKLSSALSPECRWILLGDKDQLASVEAGAVLGDICGPGPLNRFSPDFGKTLSLLTGENVETAAAASPMADCVVALRKNYRFPEAGMIGRLSRAVNAGDADAVLDLFARPLDSSVSWHPMAAAAETLKCLEAHIIEGFAPLFTCRRPSDAIETLRRFKILCAVNFGPAGVSGINRLAESVLERKGLIRRTLDGGGRWYPGRPVLILENDYRLGLFNGDVGVAMPDPETPAGPLKVFFPGEAGEVRAFSPVRLPAHETVFAMTVHKSQGSEFERVLMILPERDVPVLTRELVYTGITRAVEKLTVLARPSILTAAVKRTISRSSGLRDRLWP